MANVLTTNFDYTYNGTEAAEAAIKPAVLHPLVTQLFTVMEGVKSKHQIGLTSELSQITIADDGSCGRTTTGDGVEITNTTLTTAGFQANIPQCGNVFKDTIWENLMNSGNDANDITNTPIKRLMEEVYVPGLSRDAFNSLSFGDTNSIDPNINIIDGLWPSLDAGVIAGEVTEVAAFNAVLVAGEALAKTVLMIESADNILDQLDENDKKIYVTRSVYQNLVSSYESVSTGSDLQVGYQQDGIVQVRVRGIEVIKLAQWDSAITTFTLGNPNRALYTTPSNHIVGFEDSNDVTSLEIWYSKDDNIVNTSAKYRMGYVYKFGGLSVIAQG
tara:strand:+ start:2107 stop:3096 length:990 start_codon:yes stop_codon:yes gene_type:complete